MAFVLSEDQLQCSICLDTFTNPVSIPCGHNFCMRCIKRFWKTKDTPECPMCKETFRYRPELRINVGLRDIAEQCIRSNKPPHHNELPQGTTEPPTMRPSDVTCDICIEEHLTAVKSCLVCQESYCAAHLIPHQRDPALQRHRMSDPATFATRNLCRTHNQKLEMFCKTDHMPVCMQCTKTEHRDHTTVILDKESKKIKRQLTTMEEEFYQMIQHRLIKAEEIKHSIKLSQSLTQREIQSSMQMYTMFANAIERNQAELIQELEDRQGAAEKRAKELLDHLEQEVNELQRRRFELKHLEHTDNPLHIVQSFPSLCAPLSTKDWVDTSVYTDSCMGSTRRAISKLMDICQELEGKVSADEVDKTNQYAVDVTMDPATAASWVVVSADKKKVSLNCRQRRSLIPDDPLRFDSCVSILGKQGFTSGRRYWVVEVGEKTDWDLGVAKESINRKGAITVRPDCGYWAICRRKGGNLSACTGPSTPLHLQHTPQRVGIFLDYQEGMVSFYDVEAKSHIYTYSECEFGEAIYPYFNTCVHDNGKNTGPLVICPIQRGVSAMTEIQQKTGIQFF
ncbi:E3 ubiquitin-protein ligase TRIM39-like [Genypterus blacodes]|uniref:E3 ubiquitin-protein ligase TRIM39-like n=1 Tax=Genypterus blacodes TaxID=154954 RepID=UPI003F76BC6F